MSTLDELATNSGSFGSPINLVYTTEAVNLDAPSSGETLLVVRALQANHTTPAQVSATFLSFEFLKLSISYRIAPNIYYWAQYVPTETALNALLGFYNAMTNHVDQWLWDAANNTNPSSVIINPRFGDYSTLVPEYYQDEDEPIEP